MEVIFYVVLGAAVDLSEGEQRAGDYFVTRLSEHEWRRRGGEEKESSEGTATTVERGAAAPGTVPTKGKEKETRTAAG